MGRVSNRVVVRMGRVSNRVVVRMGGLLDKIFKALQNFLLKSGLDKI